MNLDPDDVRTLYALADSELHRRRRNRIAIPYSLQRSHARLQLALQCAPEPPTDDAAKLIDSKQAAAILGVSERRVRKIASDLDGEKPGWQWTFRLNAVIDYANGKKERTEDR